MAFMGEKREIVFQNKSQIVFPPRRESVFSSQAGVKRSYAQMSASYDEDLEESSFQQKRIPQESSGPNPFVSLSKSKRDSQREGTPSSSVRSSLKKLKLKTPDKQEGNSKSI